MVIEVNFDKPSENHLSEIEDLANKATLRVANRLCYHLGMSIDFVKEVANDIDLYGFKEVASVLFKAKRVKDYLGWEMIPYKLYEAILIGDLFGDINNDDNSGGEMNAEPDN